MIKKLYMDDDGNIVIELESDAYIIDPDTNRATLEEKIPSVLLEPLMNGETTTINIEGNELPKDIWKA